MLRIGIGSRKMVANNDGDVYLRTLCVLVV